ncbi:MAG TPA: glycosyltransferase 87 family protein [Chloroflexota bacterium]|nr:glycosyltransferase 87 family protein [Chloroflexota bacterium]
MSRPRPSRLVGAGALALALALDVWATAALARAMGPFSDLFPRWYGTRVWLLQGLDPYGAEVNDGIRVALGGAPGEALGAFVFGFVYPGYVALMLLPLALLPLPWAATLWLLLAQGATGLGAWMAWHGAREGARPAPAVPAVVVAVLFPASLYNLVFGQFAALVFAALGGAWLLLSAPLPTPSRSATPRRGPWRDALAGALLALAFVKPSLALLPAGALLLWCGWQGRRGALLGAILTGGALVAASVLALPGWPAAFWRSTADYAQVASATSAAGLVATLIQPLLGPAGELAVGGPGVLVAATVAVALLAVAVTGAGWLVSPRRAGDALATGVLLGSWLVPPLYEWNSVLLLVPILGWLRRRHGAGLRLATAGLLLASALSLPVIVRWPSGSRALWPALVLAAWGLVAWRRYRGHRGYRGTKRATLRASASPSSPALT